MNHYYSPTRREEGRRPSNTRTSDDHDHVVALSPRWNEREAGQRGEQRKAPAAHKAVTRSMTLFLGLSVLVSLSCMRFESIMNKTFLRDSLSTRSSSSHSPLQQQQSKVKSSSMNPMLMKMISSSKNSYNNNHRSIWQDTIQGWFESLFTWIHETTTVSYYPCPTVQEIGVDPKKYNPFWLAVSGKLQLAVTIIPKNMCSSIRDALNRLECSSQNNQRCAEARHNKLLTENLQRLNGMTRVLMVRDPIERALSAYHNSKTNRFIFTDKCPSSANCTFAEWIDDIYRHGNSWQKHSDGNEHFYSQKSIAQFDKMHYHYILRMSSPIDQDFFWTTLMKKESKLMSNASSNHTKTQRQSPRQKAQNTYQQLSRTTLEQLEALYQDDFDLWESLLQGGTRRRTRGEVTVYDIYKADRVKWPKTKNEASTTTRVSLPSPKKKENDKKARPVAKRKVIGKVSSSSSPPKKNPATKTATKKSP